MAHVDSLIVAIEEAGESKATDLSHIHEMIDNGVEVNEYEHPTEEEYYITPLHAAIGAGMDNIVDKLLEAGAKADGTCHVGHIEDGGLYDLVVTPLAFAIYLTEKEVHGIPSDAQLPDTHGMRDAIWDYIKHNDEKVAHELYAASSFAHVGAVRFLLEKGVDPNIRRPLTPSGFSASFFPYGMETALAGALKGKKRQSREDLVQLLLDHGADPDQKYGRGITVKESTDYSDFADLFEAHAAAVTATSASGSHVLLATTDGSSSGAGAGEELVAPGE